MRPLVQMPGVRRLPTAIVRPRPRQVLFDSWRGLYSDSPRAIFEEMLRRDLPFEYTWVVRPGDDTPAGATGVAPLSRGHLSAMGSAGYIICNNTLPRFFRKRSATRLVQTWHGTPLKRIGFDIASPRFDQGGAYLDALGREVGMWDVLISPNRFSTETFRRAFRYAGRIAETGYPRNDDLRSARASEIRRRTRAALGIAERSRAVLYAPTWRDSASFDLELDLPLLADALPDHVFLLRTHRLVAATVADQAHRAIIDVSGIAEPADLYLAADVLVTDYSSVMFDFALTGKPMLFFAYDLEQYRDELRGFYFDFVAEAPGPLVRTSKEVATALADLEATARRHAPAYERFVARFGHLEDGRAAARAVDAIFPPPRLVEERARI